MSIDANEQLRLIRKVQKSGDRTAADVLIKMYYDEIYVYAYRQTSDKHTAMDLTQGIFISMLRTIAGYNSRKAGFRTWLYKIATNKIIDYHRSRSTAKNKTLDIDDFEIVDDVDFTQRLENKDLAVRIQAHIAAFDTDIQRIFRLKIFAEHTFADIALITEMSEATVKTKYYRMIKTLRKEFSDEYYT